MAPPPPGPPKDRRSTFWRKLGGGSLSISIIVHVILLALGVFWIFQVIPHQEPPVDFIPKGGGGGTQGQKSETANKKRATMTSMNAPRVAAKGATSSFTLPEPDSASAISAVGSLSSGALSGGLGGSGSGGGRGSGTGKGFGSGSGPGLGGSAVGMNPFGMMNPSDNALVGVLYDLKQDEKGKPTGMTPQQHGAVMREFTGRGWNERSLSGKYFQAPRKLYQNRIYIPLMGADAAPKAFGCEKEVQPKSWLVIYRGNIIAPKTGKFRFVGTSDDTLVVRLNKKNVFDHGFYAGTEGLDTSKKDPVTYYTYSDNPHYNGNIRGYAVGPEFDVRAGSTYPIEILLSEIPGGYFGAALLIQETGVEYPKDSTGAPILPLFRLDDSPPPATRSTNAPPCDPGGDVWRLAGGRGKVDI